MTFVGNHLFEGEGGTNSTTNSTNNHNNHANESYFKNIISPCYKSCLTKMIWEQATRSQSAWKAVQQALPELAPKSTGNSIGKSNGSNGSSSKKNGNRRLLDFYNGLDAWSQVAKMESDWQSEKESYAHRFADVKPWGLDSSSGNRSASNINSQEKRRQTDRASSSGPVTETAGTTTSANQFSSSARRTVTVQFDIPSDGGGRVIREGHHQVSAIDESMEVEEFTMDEEMVLISEEEDEEEEEEEEETTF